MKKIKIAGLILAVIVGVQFIRPPLNVTSQTQNKSIIALYNPPVEVSTILQNACYDCHSDNTRYPWYSGVQPFGWLLNHHIRSGKSELNLDEFRYYTELRRKSKLRSMRDQVQDGSMPLKSYRLMHKRARMTEEQKKVFLNWIDHQIDSLKD